MTARSAVAPSPSPRRRLALVALLAGALAAPALLPAQITTGLTPPVPPPTDSQLAAADSVIAQTRDSLARAERLSMQAWVDSAAQALERGGAAVTPLPELPGDSLVPDVGTPPTTPVQPTAGAAQPPASQPPAPRTPAPPAPPPPDDQAGATAPDTASPLPLLAAAGLTLTGLGMGLLRRR